jgi:hypothetical protein
MAASLASASVFLAFGLVELLIVVAIIAIIALLLMGAMKLARDKAIAQLRAQLSGTMAVPPPNPVPSSLSPINYTLTLGPMATAIGPASPIHTYLSVQVTYSLTGAGGAVFPDGSRSFSVPMSATGQALAAVRAVSNAGDHLKISYIVTDKKTGGAVTVPEPIEFDFETTFP